MKADFYLGAHGAHWLWHPYPASMRAMLFLSVRILARLVKWHPARVRWVMDSNAFTQINKYGRFLISQKDYARLALRAMLEIGLLDYVAIQDYMCEEEALLATGLTILDHQRLTVDSFLRLRDCAPSVKWMPVIQGYSYDDYMRCIDMYWQEGVELDTFDRVGIGSVCRRQHTAEIIEILKALQWVHLPLHGFGVKTKALERLVGNEEGLLASCDSMAWSRHARNRAQLPGCNHKHEDCNGCLRYALKWRQRLLVNPNLIAEAGDRCNTI